MSDNCIYVSVSEDGGSYFIIVDEVKYKCSYSESAILSNLLANKGKFYTKEELATIGWPNKLVSKNSVPVAIANVRKIFKSHTNLDVITNEKNKGYTVLTDKVQLTETGIAVDAKDSVLQSVSISESEQNTASKQTDAQSAAIEKKFQFGSVKRIALLSLGYPLLIVNIALLMLLIFGGRTTPKPAVVDVIDSDHHVAIYTKDNKAFSSLISTESDNDKVAVNTSTLQIIIEKAIHDNKSVVFVNTVSNGVVVDCLQDKELFSYSGNDLEAIVANLKTKGCKI